MLVAWPFGGKSDVLVCMVTSQRTSDPNAIPIAVTDLLWADLPLVGFVRPLYLFAGSEDLFEVKGEVSKPMVERILKTVRARIGTAQP